MEKEKIRQIVIETFNEYYDEDYKLLEITNNSTQINYAILSKGDGIIVDFWVSNYSIFEAKSSQNLLNSIYKVKTWLAFITTTEERLRQERDKENA